MLGNDIYCSVGIYYLERKEWVWKDDAGSSGTIEVEKSRASDSFKRACVNATGVGRELYTAPEIKIWKQDENDDSFKYNHYFVKDIDYKDNEISKLIICEEKSGEVVFSYPRGAKVSQTSEKAPKKDILAEASKGIGENFLEESGITPQTKQIIQDLVGQFTTERWNNFKEWLTKTFGTGNIADLTEEQGKQVIKVFKK